MSYCTVSEVKAAINFPDEGSPVSDSDIEDFILDSQEEIERIYNTNFGNVEESGTADGDFSTTTLSLTTLDMTADEYVGYVLWIYDGTNSGEYRKISANDSTKITVDTAFSSATDGTSKFRVVKLGYKDEDLDGTGTDTMFTTRFPLIKLNEVTIGSTSVTPSYVYSYDTGRLVLGTDNVEATKWDDNVLQNINLKYIYGVYPIPRIIKRLCVIFSAMRTVAAKMSGSYTDFSTVSLPGGINGSRGQPYVNLQAGIRELKREADNIINNVYRPFTLFA